MRKSVYIGYSTDPSIRKRATSGGIGSALVKYLLDENLVKYALSFEYHSERMSYVPVLVSSFSDYNICGSIYQEINLVATLKELLGNKTDKGRIVLFSLPCQTKALRKICADAGFGAIIIGLTCSSQQSFEATKYLLRRIGINEEDVESIRYRGNGWPSGIQIITKDGKSHFVRNNGSIWTEIFHSRLFIQQRCFSCRNTLNDYADIVLADPWLKEYVDHETIGQTLFATLTEKGEKYIREAFLSNYINITAVEESLLYESQKITIDRKEAYHQHPKIRNWMRKVFLSRWYITLVRPSIMFKLHCRLKTKLENLMTLKQKAS